MFSIPAGLLQCPKLPPEGTSSLHGCSGLPALGTLVLEAVQPPVFIKRDSRGMAGGGFRGTGSFPKTVLGETDFSGFPSGRPLFMITAVPLSAGISL